MSFSVFALILDIPGDVSAGLPNFDRATIIGISVAVAGNILISLALNLQKLAHQHIDRENTGLPEDIKNDNRQKYLGRMERVREASTEDEVLQSSAAENRWVDGDQTPCLSLVDAETPTQLPANYGSSSKLNNTPQVKKRRPLLALFSPKPHLSESPDAHQLPTRTSTSENTRLLPTHEITSSNSSASNGRGKRSPASSIIENGNESGYLKSKVWWMGFLLMNVGELGNFISYAFAPASVVAPLGTFALVANCFFAPLILKERFRKVEIFGILIAIIGAVTVVFSANSSETRLDRDALIHAISQRPFIVYSAVYIIGAIILSSLSAGPYGRDWIIIDVGICALFGGFTVLSTKALSTLLTMEWIRIFTEWITYPIIIILVGTGVGQIRYLNRALIRFDSKTVVPTQFVLFSLSAIIGSGILYGDFRDATFHQMVTFLYGCAATFVGVFMIARSAPSEAIADEESENTDPQVTAPHTPGEVPRLPLGSLRARNDIRPTSIRRKQSSGSLVGFSPAQRLLLVHTPPERHSSLGADGERSPDSANGRQRALSWLGDDFVDRQQNVRRAPPSNESLSQVGFGMTGPQ